MSATRSVIEGSVLLGMGIIGSIGNCLAIPYFSWRIKRQWNYYTLLIYLAVFDSIVVVSGILLYALSFLPTNYRSTGVHLIIAPVMLPLSEIGSTGSIYFTMAISIERYFVICRPLYHRVHAFKSKTYIIPILLFTIVYNIPRFFELQTDYCKLSDSSNATLSNCSKNCVCPEKNYVSGGQSITLVCISPTLLRQNKTYYGIYHVGCNIVFLYFIPIIVLAISNIQIIRKLISYQKIPGTISTEINNQRRHSVHPNLRYPSERQRRQNQVNRAKVVLVISGIFVVCNTCKWSVNAFEFYVRFRDDDKRKEESIAKDLNTYQIVDVGMSIGNSLVMFISSINFYVYMLKQWWAEKSELSIENNNVQLQNIPKS